MDLQKNRFILRSFLPAGKGREHAMLVVEDGYTPTQRNTPGMLLLGLAFDFVSNSICVACALVHGDIRLHYEFSAAQPGMLLVGFLMVFVQSSSEELWCRGFMYERLAIRYPLWVSVVMNGVFFGLIHISNDGVSALAIINIVFIGFAFSLLRWYTGSIWLVMGYHTMWNFTQNLLFGLPNSGFVTELSVFHLDAANGVGNLIYDYEFGVEGAIPTLVIYAAVSLTVLLLAKRDGRLGELGISYQKKAALDAAAEQA